MNDDLGFVFVVFITVVVVVCAVVSVCRVTERPSFETRQGAWAWGGSAVVLMAIWVCAFLS